MVSSVAISTKFHLEFGGIRGICVQTVQLQMSKNFDTLIQVHFVVTIGSYSIFQGKRTMYVKHVIMNEVFKCVVYQFRH